MTTTTSSTNYYEILEVPSDSGEREIKAAYHRLARQLHPDKAATPEEARRVEEQFALVSAAYNALKDPEKRVEYDRTQGKDGTGARSAGASASPAPSTATARVLAASRSRAATPPPVTAAVPPSATPSGGFSRQNAVITPERVAIAQKAFARGMQLYKENNVAKAIDFFEAAIQNNESEAIYHARMGMALIREKRSATRALAFAQRAIDLDPYNLDYKFDLAFIYEMIGSKTNAVKIYEDILRWDAGNSRAKLAMEGLVDKKRGPFGLGGSGGGNGADATKTRTKTPTAAAPGGVFQRILDMFNKK